MADSNGYLLVIILDTDGIVIGEELIACVKQTPFLITRSKFGVIDVLFGPKHLSALNESIKKKIMLGFINTKIRNIK